MSMLCRVKYWERKDDDYCFSCRLYGSLALQVMVTMRLENWLPNWHETDCDSELVPWRCTPIEHPPHQGCHPCRKCMTLALVLQMFSIASSMQDIYIGTYKYE